MKHQKPLIELIDDFISATGMGESYFGKKAAKNSELIPRLRRGGRVLVETDLAVRQFIKDNLPNDKAPVREAS